MKAIRKLPIPDRRPIAGAAIFVWVAVSPWVWGFADAHPAVASHVALVFGFGPLALLIANLRAAAVVTLLGGLWLVASPWVLGYAGDGLAWLNELVTGAALIVLCADAAGVAKLQRARRRARRSGRAGAGAGPGVTAAAGADPVVIAAAGADPVVIAAAGAEPVVPPAAGAEPGVTAAAGAGPGVTAGASAEPVVTAEAGAEPGAEQRTGPRATPAGRF